MSHRSGVDLVWNIAPLRTPLVYRRCNRCDARRAFASSHKFRVNSQHKRMDAWLIYKCAACQQTWKCAIFSRRTLAEIDRDLYYRLVDNDERTAWSYAFDRALLRRNQVAVEAQVDYEVRGAALAAAPRTGTARVRVVCDFALPLRLDRLLSRQLELGRGQVKALWEAGAIGADRVAKLTRPATGDLLLVIDLDAVRALRGAGR